MSRTAQGKGSATGEIETSDAPVNTASEDRRQRRSWKAEAGMLRSMASCYRDAATAIAEGDESTRDYHLTMAGRYRDLRAATLERLSTVTVEADDGSGEEN